MLKYRKNLILSIIILIGIILLVNIVLTYQNSKIIEENRQLQTEAEKIKVSTLDIIRTLHLLDLGIRGKALVDNDQIASAMDSASFRKNKIIRYLENALASQNFQMEEFYRMKDSTEAYFQFVAALNLLIENDQYDEFLEILSKDPGHDIWMQYKKFSSLVNQFEDQIAQKATIKYFDALQNSYWLQIILFLMIMPTLGYLTIYFKRSLSLSEKLRINKGKHNLTLVEKNQELKRLLKRVEKQSMDLQKANQDLDDYNKKLEQFAFFVAHDIRGPVARVKGLSNIMEGTRSKKEIKKILKKLIYSAEELDHVVNELGMMVEKQ
jgi:signal transduction histidine kinase